MILHAIFSGRISELSRAKQESAQESRERITTLENHLEEARRRMLTLEMLKKENAQLKSQALAQESVIEGLRYYRSINK